MRRLTHRTCRQQSEMPPMPQTAVRQDANGDEMSELPRIRAMRRTGDERFTRGDHDLGFALRDFWCWSTSDLLNNTTRGVLAEFLVAQALGVPTTGVREPWAAYDLETEDRLKVEVKSSAYLQSWHQKQKSS